MQPPRRISQLLPPWLQPASHPPRDPGETQPGGDPRPLQVPGQHHARQWGAGPGDPEADQCCQPVFQVPQKVSVQPTPQPPQGQVAGARSPQARDHYGQTSAVCGFHPGAPLACRLPPLHVDVWGHTEPQHSRAPATGGPPPRLALHPFFMAPAPATPKLVLPARTGDFHY